MFFVTLVHYLLIATSGDYPCSTAWGCVGLEMWGTSDTIIGCYGYAACMNASMDNSRGYSYAGNRCRSRSGCLGATRISGSADQAGRGEGFLAMEEASGIDITNSYGLLCMGEATCFNVKSFVSTTDLLCEGALSCTNINKNNKNGDNGTGTRTVNIYGYGMYSLKDSWISGNSDISGDRNNFYMYGFYSGFNTHLVCPSGHNCHLYCGSSGCFNLTFDCDISLSSCNIHYENSFSTYSDDVYHVIDMIDVEEGYLLDYFKYNEDGNYYSNNNVYDISNECDFSCVNNSDCSSTDLIASSSSSSSLTSLCCVAGNSCQSSDIFGWENVYVDSSWAAFYSNFQNISGVIRIRGRGSGWQSSFENFGTLLFTGESKGYEINNTNNGYYLGCFGSSTCYKTTISNVEYIVGTGYLSLYNSTITSTTKDVNIYLLGHESGSGLNINCNNGCVCNLYLWTAQMYNKIKTIECNSCQLLRIYDIEKNFEIIYQLGTNFPTYNPTRLPTDPTSSPTPSPTGSPTGSSTPTGPTLNPMKSPSVLPSYYPSNIPTNDPTPNPTHIPTNDPTGIPTPIVTSKSESDNVIDNMVSNSAWMIICISLIVLLWCSCACFCGYVKKLKATMAAQNDMASTIREGRPLQ